MREGGRESYTGDLQALELIGPITPNDRLSIGNGWLLFGSLEDGNMARSEPD